MIQSTIVILEEDFVIHRAIIDNALKQEKYVKYYYSEDYINLVKRLNSDLDKIGFDEGQIILVGYLDSVIAYKDIIYLYLESCVKDLNKNIIKKITDILSRFDSWIIDIMNTNSFDDDLELNVLMYSELEKKYKLIY